MKRKDGQSQKASIRLICCLNRIQLPARMLQCGAEPNIEDQIAEFRRRIDNFYGIDYCLGRDFDT